MTITADKITEQTLQSQNDGEANRKGTKQTIDGARKLLIFGFIILLGIIIVYATKWSFAMGIIYAMALFYGLSKVKVFGYDFSKVGKVMGILFLLGTIALSPMMHSFMYILNETEDCISTIGNESNNTCFEAAPPPPGSESVTKRRYMGVATGGTHELRADSWLIFHWEDGTCIAIADRDGGFIEKKLDEVDEYWLLSRKGSELIRVKTLEQGQTWEGMTCKK